MEGDRWSLPRLDALLADLRYAGRTLRRTPAFAMTVIATLGLGIGANATMFGVVDRLMFRPLAYLHDPERVHRVYWQWQEQGRRVTSLSGPYTRYLDLQRSTSSFDLMAAFQERVLAVGVGEEARERRVGLVSASYFAFFDATPVLGRFFTADEDVTPRGAEVAVLSHATWLSEFGARDVRGTLLQVGNVRAQIIGVAPPGFAGVNDGDPPALWIPITTFAGSEGTDDARTYYTHYRWGWAHTLARRKPGIGVDVATTDARHAFRRSWDAQRPDQPNLAPAELARPGVVISSVRPGAGPEPSLEARTALWVLAVAVIVLVIAAANVSNLLVARALQRQREVAMRLALGASTRRLLSQSVVESVLLAALGAGAAVLIAHWGTAAIMGLLGASPDNLAASPADWRTIGAAFVISLVTGIAIGMVPAFLVRRGPLTDALRSGARGGTSDGRVVRRVLLVLQAGLSTTLLIGAFLFTRSLDRVQSMRMGYDATRVLVVSRMLRGPWPGVDAVQAITNTLVTEAQALPQVEAAAWVVSAPFISTSSVPIFVEGVDAAGSLGTFYYQVSTPDYFRTMGTRIVRGRPLDATDRMGAPDVAVVSESMARLLWPGRDALGQCFRARADTMPCITVVGVAEDMVQREVADAPRLHYYLSLQQSTRSLGNAMVIRVRGEASLHAEEVRRALQRVLPANVYLVVRPLSALVHDAQRSWRLGATMFAAFGLLALLVAAIGLYGTISTDVARRAHETALRVALGASRAHVLRAVLGTGVRLVAFGVLCGVGVALGAGRWVQPLLYRQPAHDPTAYLGTALLMLGVAVGASLVPAHRATRSDPAAILRQD